MKSIESIITFLAYTAIIAFAIGSLKQINAAAEEKLDSFEAKTEAEKCAGIIDSFYSNTGGSFEGLSLKCHTKNNGILSAKNNSTANAKTIAEHKKITSANEKTFIEIETTEHYEK